MVKTLSTMIDLGTVAPDFQLMNANPNTHPLFGDDTSQIHLSRYTDHIGYLIAFICNHCPYVKHVADAFSKISRDYLDRGILTFGISSNDVVNYPEDSPDKMTFESERRKYCFPYLYDASQEVAKSYRAACTPDFFLFDSDKKCVYRGQMDDSRPETSLPVNGSDLILALDRLFENQIIPSKDQKASIGCNIKWRLGNEPNYFR